MMNTTKGTVAGANQEVELPDARPKERRGDSLPSMLQPRFIFHEECSRLSELGREFS
jgi:hypothetical protein